MAPDILNQVTAWRTRREGGFSASLSLELCGVPVQIHFTEKHLLDLQEILKSAEKATQPLDPNVTLKEASWSSVLFSENSQVQRTPLAPPNGDGASEGSVYPVGLVAGTETQPAAVRRGPAEDRTCSWTTSWSRYGRSRGSARS